MKKLTTRQIALNGVAAGLYAAITILTASFAYGNIQFRIADALCVLVVLEPSLTVGLTLGCLISNIFSTVSALDIVIGTAGTLLGCLLAARVKKDWLVPVPIMLANAVLVGAMLAYVLTPTALVQGFFINGGEVLLGERRVPLRGVEARDIAILVRTRDEIAPIRAALLKYGVRLRMNSKADVCATPEAADRQGTIFLLNLIL